MEEVEFVWKKEITKIELWKVLRSCRAMRHIVRNTPHKEGNKDHQIILSELSKNSKIDLINYIISEQFVPLIDKEEAEELLTAADYLGIDHIVGCLNWKDRKCTQIDIEDYMTEEEIEKLELDEEVGIRNISNIRSVIREKNIEVKEGYMIGSKTRGENTYLYFYKRFMYDIADDFAVPVELADLMGTYYPFKFWGEEKQFFFNFKGHALQIDRHLKYLGKSVYESWFQILHRRVKIFIRVEEENTFRMSNFLQYLGSPSYIRRVSNFGDSADFGDIKDDPEFDDTIYLYL